MQWAKKHKQVQLLWKLFVDGSSKEKGVGAGLRLINPKEHTIHCLLLFKFNGFNNEIEYDKEITS